LQAEIEHKPQDPTPAYREQQRGTVVGNEPEHTHDAPAQQASTETEKMDRSYADPSEAIQEQQSSVSPDREAYTTSNLLPFVERVRSGSTEKKTSDDDRLPDQSINEQPSTNAEVTNVVAAAKYDTNDIENRAKCTQDQDTSRQSVADDKDASITLTASGQAHTITEAEIPTERTPTDNTSVQSIVDEKVSDITLVAVEQTPTLTEAEIPTERPQADSISAIADEKGGEMRPAAAKSTLDAGNAAINMAEQKNASTEAKISDIEEAVKPSRRVRNAPAERKSVQNETTLDERPRSVSRFLAHDIAEVVKEALNTTPDTPSAHPFAAQLHQVIKRKADQIHQASGRRN
jgi:hypothetical protein